MSFLNTDLFFLRIYYEDCIWEFLHILDTAKVLFKLIPFFLDVNNFLLRKNIKCTIF